MSYSTLAALLLGACVAHGGAVHPRQSNGSISALSPAQIDTFTPYTWFTSTASCVPSATLTWSCGANCDANPGFKPIASGGDGAFVQYWYVGYDPSLATVIVAHQATDASKIIPILTDIDLFLTSFDSTLFPGLSSSIQVHSGFKTEQAQTATAILAAVQSGLQKYGATSVTTVGHSLGAALSLIDSVYLPLHLPSNTTFKTVLYGLPMVGNQAFADYVDSDKVNVTHIHNREDPIPTLPGTVLGYRQPSGEVHITDAGVWEVCPGQDNNSTLCTAGDVPTLLQGNLTDHGGPYGGIALGC
ncbi:hypothetical protein PLICRDRAFT_114670 [Plicaturopsis crispa FD-325 SS-3]|nr:hypothetical protein PLICRDRAFT_114670 [Plicaturopsis crispa FD-325 SS-3]